MWGIRLVDIPTIALAVFWLVLLEGLLSGDNALVLAVMVKHLPKHQQRRALRYGIWGAFLFRFLAVLSASYLLRFWQLKVLGGLYLIWLAIKHFLLAETAEDGGRKQRFGSGFWATVVNVEIADIAFSIDSILAAVAMAQGLPQHLQNHYYLRLTIIYTGGVLGIVMMRLVAGVFLILLERFKGLAAGAYYLVAWIGLKLIGSGFGDALDPQRHRLDQGWRAALPDALKQFPWEMPDWLFWLGMLLIVAVSMLYKPHGGDRSGMPVPEQEHPASPDGSPSVLDEETARADWE
ncbi:MAG: TerC family protein [Isosphaeraceae bacterium]|nr:TerC family protein [Isosphaeraceae bacterium]